MEAILRGAARISGTVSVADAAVRGWDVVVVGAGPGGSTTARALAAAGKSVLLVDKAQFPREKVCGCCLSGAALATLRGAGLGGVLAKLRGTSLERLEIRSSKARAELAIGGWSVSRSALDAALIREAIVAGADFLPGAAAAVQPSGGNSGGGLTLRTETDGVVPLNSGLVVVSDGLAGTAIGDRPLVSPGGRIGLSTIIDSPFESGLVRMAYSGGGYVGLVRLEDGRLNLAAAIDPEFVRSRGGPAEAVAAILADAGVSLPSGFAEARWHGTPTLTRRRRHLWRPGVLVLGDAAAYVEPFTGEGMGWAVASGLAAADLIVRGRPREWPAAFARLIRRRQRTCRAIAWALRRPLLVRAAIRTLAIVPRFAGPAIRHVQAPLLKEPA